MKTITNPTFIKGLLMFVITAVYAMIISMNGFPRTNVQWALLGLTVVTNVLIYLGKNLVFPSVSLFGTINVSDFLSGLFVVVGTAISSWVASSLTATVIDWTAIIHLALSVGGTYLVTKFGFGKVVGSNISTSQEVGPSGGGTSHPALNSVEVGPSGGGTQHP